MRFVSFTLCFIIFFLYSCGARCMANREREAERSLLEKAESFLPRSQKPYVFEMLFLLPKQSKTSRQNLKSMLTNFRRFVTRVMDSYPGSMFATGYFGSKACDESCYQRDSDFTTDVKSAPQIFETDYSLRVELTAVCTPGFPLLGTAVALVDPKIGWSGIRVTSTGKRVVRLVVLYTNCDFKHPLGAPRVPPQGDANDCCLHDQPDLPQFSNILEKHNAYVLVVTNEEQPWVRHTENLSARTDVVYARPDAVDYLSDQMMFHVWSLTDQLDAN